MSVYLKTGSVLVLVFFGLKFRAYLKRKLFAKESDVQTIHKQMVLFFPETQFGRTVCCEYTYEQLLTKYPTSVFCQLLTALKSSRRSLDICMFSLSFEPIVQLIQDLGQNGINVRIVVNVESKCQTVSTEEPALKTKESHYLLKLFRYGVELKFVSLSNDRLMHNKFAVIDNNLLINGSLNWTENSIFSYNDCILTTDSKLVLFYLKHFNEFWSQNSF